MSKHGRKDRARILRRNMTDAERHLWYHLRAHRLSGYKFRRQYPIDRYIVDFACVEAGLVVEADGGQHVDPSLHEHARSEYLESRGFLVLRFWNDEILANTDAVLERILSALAEGPLPNPSPGGRGARGTPESS